MKKTEALFLPKIGLNCYVGQALNATISFY